MEKCATSVYDILYIHKLTLTDADVIAIAIEVVKTIVFCDGQGLRHLTSRKVLLETASRVKLLGLFQRDILEMANVPIAPSPYQPPATTSAQAGDVYAFGVLLWELCCGDKPTVELFGRIAQVRLARPSLGLDELIRACTHEDPGLRPSSKDVLASLVALQARVAPQSVLALCLPTAPALDGQGAADPPPVVPSKDMWQGLKRLESVEQQLVDEQRNFDIVVGQLDFAAAEITSLQRVLDGKCHECTVIEKTHDRAVATIASLEQDKALLEATVQRQVLHMAELQQEHRRLETQCVRQTDQLNKDRVEHEATNLQVSSVKYS